MSGGALPSPVASEAPPTALVVSSGPPQVVAVHAPGVSLELPELVGRAGEAAAFRTLEFFTSQTPNPHTRAAYGRAVASFATYCASQGVALDAIPSPTVWAWREALLTEGMSAASANAKLSGVRQWLEWLARHGVIRGNPADAVKGIRQTVTEGQTPIVERDDARKLFESLSAKDTATLRDRAMLAVMLFGGVRVSAAVRMRLGDFEDGARPSLKLREKGGKERRIACHDVTQDYLREYLAAAVLPAARDAALFPGAPGALRGKPPAPMTRQAAWQMVKRRCKAAGLPAFITPHSFRAMCATFALESGARLEDVQDLLGHALPSTTQKYNRKKREQSRATVHHVQVF
jgi:site-specific recombinase XerD